MRRLSVSLVSVLALVVSLLGAAAIAAPQAPDDHLDVYTGAVCAGPGRRHRRARRRPPRARRGQRPGRAGPEGPGPRRDDPQRRAGRAAARQGIELEPKKIDGQTVAERATALAAEGFEVFRKYSGAGGLKEEFEQAAAANPRITKLVSIGKTVNGQDIIALKVTQERPAGQGRREARRCSTSAPSTRASGSRRR